MAVLKSRKKAGNLNLFIDMAIRGEGILEIFQPQRIESEKISYIHEASTYWRKKKKKLQNNMKRYAELIGNYKN